MPGFRAGLNEGPNARNKRRLGGAEGRGGEGTTQ